MASRFQQFKKRMAAARDIAFRRVLADLFCTIGLAALGVGLWWRAPWLSLTVVGALLFAVGAIGSMNNAGQPKGRR